MTTKVAHEPELESVSADLIRAVDAAEDMSATLRGMGDRLDRLPALEARLDEAIGLTRKGKQR